MTTTAPKSKRPSTARSKTPAYKNRQLAPEKRLKDLLSRMTLQEKAAEKLVDANGNFDPQVLFGDFNSGGKLRITIPQSVGHMPAYYNHRPSASPGYLLDVEPGELEIMVGTSSRDEDLQKVILQVI